MSEFRIEHDTMGEVRVPVDALYSAQTQRAVENFPISGSGLEPAQIVALAQIKRAAGLHHRRPRFRLLFEGGREVVERGDCVTEKRRGDREVNGRRKHVV